MTGIGKYNGEMIHWLAEAGYDCTVVTAYPYYPYWKIQEPYFKKRFGYSTENEQFLSGGRITTHRCPMYVPAKPSGLKRILLDFTFLLSSFFKIVSLLPNYRFDTVFVVAPSFHFGLLGIIYKKLKKSKFIYHIQDLQIEAARDLNLIKSKKAVEFLFTIEDYIFSKADIISSISPGMISRIEQKARRTVQSLPNWTDTQLFYPITDKEDLRREFGFKEHERIILYSGAIGEKQGLEYIIQAAQEFRNQLAVKFIICGSGPYKNILQAMAKNLSLQNIVFLPLQPFDKFNQFLNLADIHLVIQKATASDLVMPSKVTTILAVGGLAVITANEGSSLHTLVQEHNMGILVPAEDQQALNDGIKQALSLQNSHIAENARTYAERNLSIDKIMQSFVSTMQERQPA
ncbi:WcaI family glycosyltransferase [Hymenobacter sp. BT186]|uniref:WcaI family glycosyltransferase n=1 Tax=Hymenobacter telluris TaxID=2816474 RepID=A0A939EU11_9BACT|nr:WcaI family glycosyltransferase [Hymenobacter telluris]